MKFYALLKQNRVFSAFARLTVPGLGILAGTVILCGIAHADDNRARSAAKKTAKDDGGRIIRQAGKGQAVKDARKNDPKAEKGMANPRAAYFMDKPLGKFTPEERGLVLARIERLRKRPGTQRFLDAIQEAEDGGPDVMVARKYRIYGDICKVKNLRKHPGEVLPSICFYRPPGGGRYSTASGNYQITRQNWRDIAPFLSLSDFTPANQQRAALELIRRGGGPRSERIKLGFLELEKGRIKNAIRMATQDWASSIDSNLPAGVKMDYWPIAEKIRTGKISVNNGLGPGYENRKTKTTTAKAEAGKKGADNFERPRIVKNKK